MANEVDALVDDITDRVKRRLDALRVGKEEPCTTGPSKSKTTASSDPATDWRIQAYRVFDSMAGTAQPAAANRVRASATFCRNVGPSRPASCDSV